MENKMEDKMATEEPESNNERAETQRVSVLIRLFFVDTYFALAKNT